MKALLLTVDQPAAVLSVCALRPGTGDIVVYLDKLIFNIFELAEVGTSSQQRKGWLSEQDSNSNEICPVEVTSLNDT